MGDSLLGRVVEFSKTPVYKPQLPFLMVNHHLSDNSTQTLLEGRGGRAILSFSMQKMWASSYKAARNMAERTAGK